MKRIVLLICVALVASGFGAAGAYFTAQQSVPDNVISAGTVAVSTEPTSEAISMENLAPGTPQSRTLSVTNTGSLPVDVRVTGAKRAGITAFFNVLECTVKSGDQTVYSGLLSELATSPVPLAPGQSAALDFAVLVPVDAPNTLSGDYVRLTLYVDAEQAR
jgi:hypothetical protein